MGLGSLVQGSQAERRMEPALGDGWILKPSWPSPKGAG